MMMDIGENLRSKIAKMLGIAEDAADDAVAIAVIAINAAERIADKAFCARAVVKPIAEAISMDDLTAITLAGYKKPQIT